MGVFLFRKLWSTISGWVLAAGGLLVSALFWLWRYEREGRQHAEAKWKESQARVDVLDTALSEERDLHRREVESLEEETEAIAEKAAEIAADGVAHDEETAEIVRDSAAPGRLGELIDEGFKR
jgi:hypothetical protein